MRELTYTPLRAAQVFARANGALNTAMPDEMSDERGVCHIESLLLQQLPATDPNIQLIGKASAQYARHLFVRG